jgi:hypothetical protein
VTVKAARESDLVKACLQYLQLKRIFAFRNNTGAAAFAGPAGRKRFVRFSTPGAADILGVLPGGKFLAVEVKRTGGKLTAAQAAFLDHVRAAGGLSLVVRSVDDLAAALRLEGVL